MQENPQNYDIEELTGNESEVIEMVTQVSCYMALLVYLSIQVTHLKNKFHCSWWIA